MRKVILASHGALAEGMRSAAEMILGNTQGILAYGLTAYESPEKIYYLIKKEIEQAPDEEYIILCDISGGSVHTQLMRLCCYSGVFLMTGMTLSAVLDILFFQQNEQTEKRLKETVESARKGIRLFDRSSVRKEIDKGVEDDDLW